MAKPRKRKAKAPAAVTRPSPGRPTLFTRPTCAAIERSVRGGLRLTAAAQAEGVSPQVLTHWRNTAEAGSDEHAMFFSAIARAEAAFERECLDGIQAAARPTESSEGDWKAGGWLLERTRPEHYAPSQTLLVKAQDAAAQDVLATARECLPPEWYAVLLARLSGAGDSDAAESDTTH